MDHKHVFNTMILIQLFGLFRLGGWSFPRMAKKKKKKKKLM